MEGKTVNTTTELNEKDEPIALPVSLRDYFAAKAMPLAFQYWRECTEGVDGNFVFSRTEDEGDMDLIAADCYEMADAMLKARGDTE